MEISPATIHDATELTALTMRSKSHWGYSSDQMEKWREELTITPDYITKHHVFLLKKGASIPGYYSYCDLPDKVVELDNLFVDPEFMGQGVGKTLMKNFMDRIKTSGYQKIILYADPNAEKFYEKYGFLTVEQLPSSVPGRTLPIMEFKLTNDQLVN